MLIFCTWVILKPDPKTVHNHADVLLSYVELKIEKVLRREGYEYFNCDLVQDQ